MKRTIKVKENELIDRLNVNVKKNATPDKKPYEAPSVHVGVDTAEGEDKTTVTVYKDGTPVKHYDGNDEWKNDYFSGKTVVENQVDLDPVKNMTEDEKKIFNDMGPCSLEDIHRDSIKDAEESRVGVANSILPDRRNLAEGICYKRIKSDEPKLAALKRALDEYKDTRSRTQYHSGCTSDNNEQCKCEHYEEVNHPQHYNNYDVEVIDMMERVFGKKETAIFCKLNAFKYRMRAGTKPGQSADKDLNKEQWYLNKKKELES